MSQRIYQVVGECAHVTADTAMGPARVLLYKGALVPADAKELKHLLSAGLVAQVGGDETGGVNADGLTVAEAEGKVDTPAAKAAKEADADPAPTPAEVQTAAVAAGTPNADEPSAEEKAAAEVAERRKAARERLAALGGKAPDGRASQDVLVEYLVAQGGNYDDLSRAEKPDLVDMVKARQS